RNAGRNEPLGAAAGSAKKERPAYRAAHQALARKLLEHPARYDVDDTARYCIPERRPRPPGVDIDAMRRNMATAASSARYASARGLTPSMFRLFLKHGSRAARQRPGRRGDCDETSARTPVRRRPDGLGPLLPDAVRRRAR